jgi:hypothetical protein
MYFWSLIPPLNGKRRLGGVMGGEKKVMLPVDSDPTETPSISLFPKEGGPENYSVP